MTWEYVKIGLWLSIEDNYTQFINWVYWILNVIKKYNTSEGEKVRDAVDEENNEFSLSQNMSDLPGT